MQTDIQKLSFKVVFITYLLIFLLCNCPLTITGLVIAGINWNRCGTSPNDPTPNNTLNIWIIVYCSVGLGMGLLTLLMIPLVFKVATLIPLLCILLLAGLFVIAWFIYGAVLIFGEVGDGCRYLQNSNGEYPGYPVWAMALAIWIIALINCIFQGCGVYRRPFAARSSDS
jgi:hypothetical protein